ncbi:MAG: iron chelate uptake ABC transporter family permease subunit [Armatimonadia bacterium]|nr:iron chelate uptake ABC transporter family permease subunit [Armatimonadia bacterium]
MDGEVFTRIFTDYTLRTVALGTAALGFVSGALGSFAVLRKQALLGDATSHAALPGIAVAFLLTGSKAPLVLVLGAALAGWLGTLAIMTIVGLSRVKYDTALGMILSVFFGVGLVLLTFIQRRPDATQAGLDTYLFGQAATLLDRDVKTIAGLGAIALLAMALLWKELKLLSFDPDFGATLGFPMRGLDIILTSLIVIAIVIGLQAVGVVLMSAMVVAPAAAARQWTDKLGIMVPLAGVFGALSGVTGAVISSSATRMPTGPVIVLCVSAVAVASLLLAPNRGLFPQWLRSRRQRHAVRKEAVLSDLRALEEQHAGEAPGHSAAVLRMMAPNPAGVSPRLQELSDRGWVAKTGSDEWTITEEGLRALEAQLGSGGDER